MTGMDSQTEALRPPLFISSRLMAAIRVGDHGATIHVEPVGHTPDGRIAWRYIVEDNAGQVLDDATDLHSGIGDQIDSRRTLATLLSFLSAAAESYRHTMTGPSSDNADMFPPDLMEWAYEHDDELAALALELDQPAPGPAPGDALWLQTWNATGCADCAAAAAQGRPTGPEHCWATHRPHTPPPDTTNGGGDR
jgi:hypothetical protein